MKKRIIVFPAEGKIVIAILEKDGKIPTCDQVAEIPIDRRECAKVIINAMSESMGLPTDVDERLKDL